MQNICDTCDTGAACIDVFLKVKYYLEEFLYLVDAVCLSTTAKQLRDFGSGEKIHTFKQSTSNDTLIHISKYFRHLQSADFNGCSQLRTGLTVFLAKCTKLHHIDVSRCGLNDDDFKALAKTCKQLRSLGMKHASNLSNYDRASNLITYDGLSAFAASCTHLNLPYGYFSTDFLTDIANNFKQLQSLNLWGVCTNDSVLEALYRLIANNYKVFLFPVLI